MNSQPSPATSPWAAMARRLIWVVVWLGLVGGLTALAVLLFDPGSFLSLLLAWVVCLLAALLGHVLGELPRGHQYMMVRLMSSMGVRAGIPLLAAVLVRVFLPDLLGRGFVYFIILFYLVGIISDVALHMKRLESA